MVMEAAMQRQMEGAQQTYEAMCEEIVQLTALLEPQEEIYKCATCAEKNGSFAPQHGIKPEYSCGEFPAVLPAPTFPDGMTAEDDRRFLELTSGLTHNA